MLKTAAGDIIGTSGPLGADGKPVPRRFLRRATVEQITVIIIPDKDTAGEKHLAQVSNSLACVAAKVRVLRLPTKDAHDWIAAGGTANQLWRLLEENPQQNREAPPARLVSRCAADIEPESINWSWEGRIARGKLTVIGGDPEEGKSQLGVFVSARISTGGAWPNNEGRAQLGSVIILLAEDGAEDTLVPRLIAAGADRSKIHLIEAVRGEDEKGRRTFNLQTDLELLEAKIAEIGDVQAIIIDPASAYMGKGVDSHNDQAVRGCWRPWQRWRTASAWRSSRSCISTRVTPRRTQR
jgi:hypothetical protein